MFGFLIKPLFGFGFQQKLITSATSAHPSSALWCPCNCAMTAAVAPVTADPGRAMALPAAQRLVSPWCNVVPQKRHWPVLDGRNYRCCDRRRRYQRIDGATRAALTDLTYGVALPR